jgi:hypothetical protein
VEKHKGDEFLVFTFLIIANAKAVESVVKEYLLLKVIAKLTLKIQCFRHISADTSITKLRILSVLLLLGSVLIYFLVMTRFYVELCILNLR